MKSYPRFRRDLIISEYVEQSSGRTVVLKEPVSERFFRVSGYEFQLLHMLDGSISIETAVQILKSRGTYYSLNDAEHIVGRAAQCGLVLGTRTGTAEYLISVKEMTEKQNRLRRLTRYYFLTVPLIDPDRFLERTLGLFKLLANRWTALLFAAAIPGAVLMLIVGWPRIEREYLFFFNWTNLFYLWVMVVLTKLVHEFAHAYTAKSYNLHVPQMGVAFLIFVPCLYCNTTDAWQLGDRRQRMAISAAGILAEAAMAVASTYIWYFSAPGLLNSLAFYLMAVSLVSTLIFNGNPLMRFDGYFVLMDYLRIPNLGTKAIEQVKFLFMNGVLGMESVTGRAESGRQAAILTVYGISSFVYRIFLYTGIVAAVYYRFDKFVGIMLAVPALALFVALPVGKGIYTLWERRAEIGPRYAASALFLLVTAFVGGLLFTPWAGTSVYPCFVTSGKTQKITVPLHTSVREVFVAEGTALEQGEVLFTLDTTLLDLALFLKEMDREIVRREIELLLLDEKKKAAAEAKRIELYKVEDELKNISHRLIVAGKGMTAPFPGVITSLDYRMQEGFKPGEGAVVGEVKALDEEVVHALIPEEDLDKVHEGQTVKLWFPVNTGLVLTKRVESIRRHSEENLENTAFSSRLGGDVATEEKGQKRLDAPLNAYYSCSVKLGRDSRLPLGITGKLIVPSRPSSLVSRMVSRLVKTFNRESLL